MLESGRDLKLDFEDQEKLILIALNQAPHSKQEIKNIIKRLAMRYGIAIFLVETENIEEFTKIEKALSYLVVENMVQVDANEFYSLTEKGEVEAQKYTKGLLTFFKILELRRKEKRSITRNISLAYGNDTISSRIKSLIY